MRRTKEIPDGLEGNDFPLFPHEKAMIALGIPLNEAIRRQMQGDWITRDSQVVPVEYPGWWKEYMVCFGSGTSIRLVRFVLDILFPSWGSRIETTYLEVSDLGRIPFEKLQGVQAIKLPLSPSR